MSDDRTKYICPTCGGPVTVGHAPMRHVYYDDGSLAAERAKSEGLRRIVDQQAEDDGLWFKAETAAEAYVQQELRKLHAAVEALSTSPSPTPQRALMAAAENVLKHFMPTFPDSRFVDDCLVELAAALARIAR